MQKHDCSLAITVVLSAASIQALTPDSSLITALHSVILPISTLTISLEIPHQMYTNLNDHVAPSPTNVPPSVIVSSAPSLHSASSISNPPMHVWS